MASTPSRLGRFSSDRNSWHAKSQCNPSSRLIISLLNVRPGIRPRFFSQKMEQKLPEKKIPCRGKKEFVRVQGMQAQRAIKPEQQQNRRAEISEIKACGASFSQKKDPISPPQEEHSLRRRMYKKDIPLGHVQNQTKTKRVVVPKTSRNRVNILNILFPTNIHLQSPESHCITTRPSGIMHYAHIY